MAARGIRVTAAGGGLRLFQMLQNLEHGYDVEGAVLEIEARHVGEHSPNAIDSSALWALSGGGLSRGSPLSRGKIPEQAAGELRVSLQPLRNQSKRTLRRTGVRRQSDRHSKSNAQYFAAEYICSKM